jgi:hypothetical protein
MQKSWFQAHRRLVMIVAAGLAAVVVIVLLVLYFFGSKTTAPNQIGESVKPAEPVRYYSPLTGRETTEPKTAAPVLAVMIENSPEARPQSGLMDAGVVFEAVAEGGITRFVVLYQEAEPSLIGPVRSVRPYYLDWAAAFDVGVAHVGGSNEAVRMAQSGNYGVDLDQFYNDSAYWRNKDRRAPHNMYTDYAHLSQLLAAKGKTSSKFTGLPRQDVGKDNAKKAAADDQAETTESAATENQASSIGLTISTNLYNVSYQYDTTAGNYKRSLGGKLHLNRALDGAETQIAPDVVIAMRVKQTLMADRLHNQIDTTGGGEIFVFQDGQVVKGTWSKSSPTAQIKFLDLDGQEIKLRRGQTWITAVPDGKEITWQ